MTYWLDVMSEEDIDAFFKHKEDKTSSWGEYSAYLERSGQPQCPSSPEYPLTEAKIQAWVPKFVEFLHAKAEYWKADIGNEEIAARVKRQIRQMYQDEQEHARRTSDVVQYRDENGRLLRVRKVMRLDRWRRLQTEEELAFVEGQAKTDPNNKGTWNRYAAEYRKQLEIDNE